MGIYRTQIRDLTLEVNQKCFQKCIFCSSDSSLKSNVELDFKTIKNILDDFKYLKGTTVELSGGEPLSYDYIYDVIKYAKNIGLNVHLFTSGFVNDVEINFNELNMVDKIFVNLQAPNKSIHDYLTNTKGSFEKAIKFIHKCKSHDMWVGTHMIPLTFNINELEEYIELAKRLKLDNVSLLRFVPQGRGSAANNSLKLNKDEILYLFKLIEKFKKIDFLEFKIGCPLDFQFIFNRKLEATPCLSGIARCVIRPNGNVLPCPAYKDSKDFFAGNIHKKSLRTIWETSPVFLQLRNFDQSKLTGLCASCSFLNICKGRCHAQRFHTYKDLYKGPDPYCPIYLQRSNLR